MLSGANIGGCPAQLFGKMMASGCLGRKYGGSSYDYAQKA